MHPTGIETRFAFETSKRLVSRHYERSSRALRLSWDPVETLEMSELMFCRYAMRNIEARLPKCNFRRNESFDSLHDFKLTANMLLPFPRCLFDAFTVTRILDFHGNMVTSDFLFTLLYIIFGQ